MSFCFLSSQHLLTWVVLKTIFTGKHSNVSNKKDFYLLLFITVRYNTICYIVMNEVNLLVVGMPVTSPLRSRLSLKKDPLDCYTTGNTFRTLRYRYFILHSDEDAIYCNHFQIISLTFDVNNESTLILYSALCNQRTSTSSPVFTGLYSLVLLGLHNITSSNNTHRYPCLLSRL